MNHDKCMKWFWRIIIVALITGLTSTVIIVVSIQISERPFIHSVSQLNPVPYAIVLGASVSRTGVASDALRDRVDTAINLYQQGKVQRLLMTGDDGENQVDEVSVMKRLALEKGVPTSSIDIDGQGYRTYESCKRAAQVYHIKQAIIVTQNFHLSRALYLCKHFGIDAQGVSADRHSYQRIVYFTLRDWLASVKAWWDVTILPPRSPVSFGKAISSSL